MIDGVKQFITSGKNGDVAIVMAVTDKAAGKKGISAFIVPTATPGYHVDAHRGQARPACQRHRADPASRTAACRPTNCLGEEGQGLKIALSGLEGGRIGIGAAGGRHGARGLRGRARLRKERVAFGKPIFEHQAVQFRLADMATQIEAARQLVRHAAQPEGRRASPA